MPRARLHRSDSAERPRLLVAGPLDLYDYAVQAAERAARPSRPEPDPITVTDDWPDILPVTDAEVRIIEAHFGDVLDELFGPLP
jgi:hypothetical protein